MDHQITQGAHLNPQSVADSISSHMNPDLYNFTPAQHLNQGLSFLNPTGHQHIESTISDVNCAGDVNPLTPIEN